MARRGARSWGRSSAPGRWPPSAARPRHRATACCRPGREPREQIVGPRGGPPGLRHGSRPSMRFSSTDMSGKRSRAWETWTIPAGMSSAAAGRRYPGRPAGSGRHRPDEAADRVQRGGLAAPVRPEERDDLAPAHRKPPPRPTPCRTWSRHRILPAAAPRRRGSGPPVAKIGLQHFAIPPHFHGVPSAMTFPSLRTTIGSDTVMTNSMACSMRRRYPLLAHQPANDAEKLLAHRGGQPDRGLVEEKQWRARGQRAHDLDHPLLSARQRPGGLVARCPMPIRSSSSGPVPWPPARSPAPPAARTGRRRSRGHLRVKTGQHVLQCGQLAEESAVLERPADALRRHHVRGQAVERPPRKVIAPELSGACPVTALNSEVLPAPFGPMMARTSPGSTRNKTPATAVSPP